MANISTWSTTAANNNSNPPDGFPENMAPSAVNDAAREMMASVRTWYEDAEWADFGYTHTYASGTSFTIAGADYTTEYHVGRRLRAVGSSTGTIYGTITASSFSTNTTVTIAWDSGSLSNEALTVSLAALSANNSAMPGVEISEDDWTHQGDVTVEGTLVQAVGADVASAGALTLGAGNFFDITGTTSITSIATKGAGTKVVLQFDAALTLTHHATNLILPTGANITTAAGDIATFYEYATGNWRCVAYTRADGTPLAESNTWVDLGTTTFSSTAEYELALSATYREYRLVVEELLPATNSVGLVATLSDGSYKSSGYFYQVTRESGTTRDSQVSSSAASMLLTTAANLGNVDGDEMNGEIVIKGHQTAGGQCSVYANLYGINGSTVHMFQAHGRYATNGAITAFKLIYSSGNLASGSITAYGLRA